jgi:AcrR family transcriptional regulator
MPPVTQFTKETIVNEAFAILAREGIDAVSARTIANALGSSTQPVYSAYASMDALKADLVAKAKAYATEYLVSGDEGEETFLSIGMQYLRLARHEREIFKLLFMTEFADADPTYPFSSPELIDLMRRDHHLGNLDERVLRSLLEDMCVFTHGLAMLIIRSGAFPDEEALRGRLQRVGGILIMHELSRGDEGDYKWK